VGSEDDDGGDDGDGDEDDDDDDEDDDDDDDDDEDESLCLFLRPKWAFEPSTHSLICDNNAIVVIFNFIHC